MVVGSVGMLSGLGPSPVGWHLDGLFCQAAGGGGLDSVWHKPHALL